MELAKPFHKLRAREIMSHEVVTISAELPAREAAAMLRRNRITGAPVIDSDHHVVGVLSMTDLLFAEDNRPLGPNDRGGFYRSAKVDLLSVAEEQGRLDAIEGKRVQDVMTDQIVSASSTTPIRELATLMLERRIHRVLIIDNQRLAGIVTVTDVLRAVSRVRQ